ncbi:hypothetical protein [Nostoc sp. T09]|uniref:hypothetical protein n=1 Tax=Nostoc sp. T09 TaxID=1932621 RepID=UPI0015C4ED84|nr:hypothetical protein [Nostoc sp. T09]
MTITLDAGVNFGTTNSEMGCADATIMICVAGADFKLDACAGFAINSIDARKSGKAIKIRLSIFIVHK